MDAHKFDVAKGVQMVNRHLQGLGFEPRDADGNDYQRGTDSSLRFKTGTSYGEITTQVMIGNHAEPAIRATSFAGLDRMMLSISGIVDRHNGRRQ